MYGLHRNDSCDPKEILTLPHVGPSSYALPSIVRNYLSPLGRKLSPIGIHSIFLPPLPRYRTASRILTRHSAATYHSLSSLLPWKTGPLEGTSLHSPYRDSPYEDIGGIGPSGYPSESYHSFSSRLLHKAIFPILRDYLATNDPLLVLIDPESLLLISTWTSTFTISPSVPPPYSSIYTLSPSFSLSPSITEGVLLIPIP